MLLINSSPKDALKIFQPFLPVAVPVGIGTLISALEKEGITSKMIDEQVEDNVLELITTYVKEMSAPYIFGFSVLTIAFNNALNLADELKRRYPDCLIIFGGIHPSALPDEVLRYQQVDVVCRGEGEQALIALYRCVKNGADYSNINNLSFRKDGEIVHNPLSPLLQNLDELPPFPYHLFTSPRYDLGFVVSSRGCPYDCIFCSNRVTTGKKYRYRSSERIVSELEYLHNAHGKSMIIFLDDNFLVNKARIYDLIGKIKERNLHEKLNFSFQARADNVSEELLTDLYDAGFKSIFFGLETASEELMKTIKKGETVAECIAAAQLAKKIGYHVSATFVYGFPGETFQDRIDCIKLSKYLQLDMVRYNNATPYPGTELYSIAVAENRLNISGLYENFVSVSSFIENPFHPIPFSYVPSGSTESQIRRDILLSYFCFYLDRTRLIRTFSQKEEGVGWFDSGGTLLKTLKKLPGLIVLGFMMSMKFIQLLYYLVIKPETRVSMNTIKSVFDNYSYEAR